MGNATYVERFVVGCAGECVGSFTREELATRDFTTCDIEQVFIPVAEFDTWKKALEIVVHFSDDLSMFTSGSITYYQAIETMQEIEKRGRALEDAERVKNMMEWAINKLRSERDASLSERERTVEQALDSIHADIPSSLNPGNVLAHAQAIDESMTKEEVDAYMREKYGWNDEFCFNL